MKDLIKHVIPLVSIKWYDLGAELLEAKHVKSLEIIYENNKHDLKTCCRKMFCIWLETSELATWDKLVKAVKEIDMASVACELQSFYPLIRRQGMYSFLLL